VITKLLNMFRSKPEEDKVPEVAARRGMFSTDFLPPVKSRKLEIAKALDATFKKALSPLQQHIPGTAMDSGAFTVPKLNYSSGNTIPESQILWYASQGFIGYQNCALLAQNWAVAKACLVPAEDATRNGFEITVNDGTEVSAEVLDDMRRLDAEFELNKNLIEFVQMGRQFGIRLAMFEVESNDPEYYSKPFNPDGVRPGSYKGISQIDPYWCAPQLDTRSASDPTSKDFYEPTWWKIGSKLVHKSHIIRFRTEEVADILKPAYYYGGPSIPQKIYERVYASERTANEAPMLALTKRTDVINVDIEAATANQQDFVGRIAQWVYNRDNYGIKALGLDEQMQQFDTSLTDFDAMIMTQYQLVAAIANMPATKILGTTPKGFNATGEYDEAVYHEHLESIQTHGLTPLIDRHHLLLQRSVICPKYGIKPFETTVSWNSLDAMTAKEMAEVNKAKAETGNALIQSGAIDGEDERKRIVSDPESGYAGLIEEDKEVNTEEEDVDVNEILGA